MSSRLSLLLLVVVVACGDRGLGTGNDASASPDDLAAHSVVQPVDLAVPVVPDMMDGGSIMSGCNGYSTCMIDCLTNPSASFSGCQTTCGKAAKSGAADRWSAVLTCGQSWCKSGNSPDSATYRCATVGDQLVDPSGAPVDTCSNCLNDALAALFGSACVNMSSPDCNPASCTTVLDACLNDLP